MHGLVRRTKLDLSGLGLQVWIWIEVVEIGIKPSPRGLYMGKVPAGVHGFDWFEGGGGVWRF